MLQAGIEALLHPVQRGSPQVLDFIEPAVHVGAEFGDPGVQIIKPGVIDQDPDQDVIMVGTVVRAMVTIRCSFMQ